MAILGITAVSAGSVDYLLCGSGCAEHEHAPPPVERGVVADAAAGGAGGGQAKGEGAQYLLSSAEREAPGVWFGGGLEEMLGIAPGTLATAEDVRAVFGRLARPGSDPKDPEYLGRPPRKFKSSAERIEAALVAEPEAGEERRREIENSVRASGRKAVAYYDLTFSPVKSVSVLHAAYRAEGMLGAAQEVVESHRAAIAAAMAYVEREAAWTRTGYHGAKADGHSVGVYEEATGLVWTRWDHSTNRNQDPQLHSHVAVLNRVIATSSRKIQALDGKAFRPIKFGAAAIYQRALERELGERLDVTFGVRPDGKAREILGVDQRLCAQASSRARQVEGNLDEAIAQFRESYGREPSPRERKQLWGEAKLHERTHKTGDLAPGAQLDNWCGPRRAALSETLVTVAASSEQVRQNGHPDQQGYTSRTRDEVLVAAVERVQREYVSWTVGNLVAAVELEQSFTPSITEEPDALAEHVLANPAAFGLVSVAAPDPGPVPAEIARADGMSLYRPHHADRWATFDQLATENAIVAGARRVGAPALAGPALELARVELVAAGLGPDQTEAAMGILSSGRMGDVLVGPAGAGKSRTVGALARVWGEQLGGRVIGVATSQLATEVLAGDGLEAYNTTRFLGRFVPDEQGLVRDVLVAGDLVVVDEASMCSTWDLQRLSDLVTAAGGKLLFTGDHQQLGAVEAGGLFEQLVRDNGAYELGEVHRFAQRWEREASVRLRGRDASVLAVYEDAGRLVGGTAEEMDEAAVRGYVADTLAGKRPLLIVRDNDTAGELAHAIREELIALGHVEPGRLATLRDGSGVSAGDLVQARRNDYDQRVEGTGSVTNRAVYRVLGLGSDGILTVEGDDGVRAHLTPDYVAHDVTLAYAGTVYAAQGRTVDSAYLLIDERANAELVYVGMTRGRESNVALVVCQRPGDEHHHEPLDTSARALLAGVLEHHDEVEALSAELRRRHGEEEGRKLSFLGGQLDLLAAEHGTSRYGRILEQELGADTAARIAGEAGRQRLARTLREAELSGNDVAAVLREAVDGRELGTAESVSDVLRWRIREHVLAGRAPEHDPSDVFAADAPGSWMDLAGRVDGAAGEYARVLAQACEQRQQELGERVAFEQSAWAVAHLGAVPVKPEARAEWTQRAGIAGAYRELRGIPETSIALGEAPPREQVLHRALWHRAYAALGAPVESVDYASATEAQLREWRAAATRERTFAPQYVADELRDTRLLAREYEQDAVLFGTEAERLPEGSPEQRRALHDVVAAHDVAAELEARAGHLEVVHQARQAWAAAAVFVDERAQLAGEELQRRGLARDLSPAPGDQTSLFTIVDDADEGQTRKVEPQLDLDLDLGAPVLVREPAPALAQAVAVEREEAGQDPAQLAAFVAIPTVTDIAAAQPLRAPTAEGEPTITVGDARRQVEILAALRGQERTFGDVEGWKHGRDEQLGVDPEHDRRRRDQGVDPEESGRGRDLEPELHLDWT
ncbi:MAG: MobF family relaxase [Pseudonocardia sp.]